MSFKVAGLDCEWVNQNSVALLQLAFPNKVCVLVRLNKVRHITPSLAAFLKDQRFSVSSYSPYHIGLSKLNPFFS